MGRLLAQLLELGELLLVGLGGPLRALGAAMVPGRGRRPRRQGCSSVVWTLRKASRVSLGRDARAFARVLVPCGGIARASVGSTSSGSPATRGASSSSDENCSCVGLVPGSSCDACLTSASSACSKPWPPRLRLPRPAGRAGSRVRGALVSPMPAASPAAASSCSSISASANAGSLRKLSRSSGSRSMVVLLLAGLPGFPANGGANVGRDGLARLSFAAVSRARTGGDARRRGCRALSRGPPHARPSRPPGPRRRSRRPRPVPGALAPGWRQPGSGAASASGSGSGVGSGSTAAGAGSAGGSERKPRPWSLLGGGPGRAGCGQRPRFGIGAPLAESQRVKNPARRGRAVVLVFWCFGVRCLRSLGWEAPCSGAARSASASSPSMSATASVASTSPAALGSAAAGGIRSPARARAERSPTPLGLVQALA